MVDIHDLKEMVERTTGTPAPVREGGRVVANVIYRDGTLLDTIRSVPAK